MLKVLVVIALAGTTAAANPTTWCKHAGERDDAWAENARDRFKEYKSGRSSQYRLFEAARFLCTSPRSAEAQKLGAEITAAWAAESGLSAKDADASIAARIDKDAWTADHDKLCTGIGEDFDDKMQWARRQLFGCIGGDPLWMRPAQDLDQDLARHADRGKLAHDDLAHLAWMLHRAWLDLETNDKRSIANYVVDQVDFRLLPTDAIFHELDDEPYKSSRYAHVVLRESLASLKQAVARVEAEVARRAKDERWKKILVTAPAKGAGDWQDAADKARDELTQLEAKGTCEKTRPYLAAMLKQLPHKNLQTFLDAISDHPLAGLFALRLGNCMMKTRDHLAAGQVIRKLAEYTRVKRGPREAAYFAALDAIAELGENSPLEAHLLPHLDDPSRDSHGKGFDNVGTLGVVASITKAGPDGEKVTFAGKKVQYMDQECRETNKIDRIDNGKVIYRTACHDTGLKWGSDAPLPVHAQTSFSSGVKVGRLIRFDDTMSDNAIPLVIFGDKQGKQLVGVATFDLQ